MTARRNGTHRKGVGKRARFATFHRDQFTCQYCGRRPPDVVLEVDHAVPVCDGGGNDDHNLVTSCFDCNRGKAGGSLEAVPVLDIEQKIALQNERAAQLAAYERLLIDRRSKEETDIDAIVSLYEQAFPKWTLVERTRPTIRNFLRSLPNVVVYEAMELACSRMNSDRAFRYFCGICWNRIRRG